MRSASSSSNAPSRSRLRLGALLLGVAALVALTGGRWVAPMDAPARSAAYRIHAPLAASAASQLHRSAWLGGAYTTSTGESVRVLVSEGYPDAQALGQRWADFLASLLHGSELGLATTYVVTPPEIHLFCGSYALGCYGSNELVFMGETVSGVTSEEVARHEYGHHVAANRSNPPWLSVAWGPKRWASAASICRRAQQGSAFPGDEDSHYELNPGEGFAEVYRVLTELKGGASSFTWSLVDPSFSPDEAALQAAEQDVVAPWTAPVTQSHRARFTRNGKRVWRLSVSTPLDGNLALSLRFPRGSLHELDVLAPGGRVLAKGLWSGLKEKRASATVCGERSLVVRVTRRGAEGKFTLRVTRD